MITTNTRAQRACIAWISDPGHAWLAVSLDDEHGFPRAKEYASSYSYYDITGDNFAGILFLEEDSDAARFVRDYGINLNLVEQRHFDDDDHFIRKLPRFDEQEQRIRERWSEAQDEPMTLEEFEDIFEDRDPFEFL